MAGNAILTIDMITRAAVSLFKNSNMFIRNINTQYDNQFAIDGAKIGDTLRIRYPNDFTVRTGTAIQIQDTSEKFTSLPLQTQKGVDVAFTSSERTLKMDDYAERMLMPMMNDLAGNIAADIMSGVETNVSNLVIQFDTAGNIINPTQNTILRANASLNDNSAPMMPRRKLVLNQWTEAAVVGNLTGLLNPATEISEQYRSGQMKNALGFDIFMDQTVINHTTGSFTAGTVNGSSQQGSLLTVNAITGTLNAGDIITIDNVNAVNWVFKLTTGNLRQFVVTANVASGATQIPIFPAIVSPVTAGGPMIQYQSTDSAPANSAAIRLVAPAGSTYRKNLAYAPESVTLATADLVLPRGVHEAARREYSGISMRMITDYVLGTDQLATRLDVIYGYKWVRGQWAAVVADTTSTT